jgi:polynucleotide 5'-kinase involved in rRNA processing
LKNGPVVQVLAPRRLWQVLFKIRAYRLDSANFLGSLVPVNKKFLEGVKRINVVGVSGSGKSTLAKQIAQRLRLAYFEMDEMFLLPNWLEPDDEDFFECIDQVT